MAGETSDLDVGGRPNPKEMERIRADLERQREKMTVLRGSKGVKADSSSFRFRYYGLPDEYASARGEQQAVDYDDESEAESGSSVGDNSGISANNSSTGHSNSSSSSSGSNRRSHDAIRSVEKNHVEENVEKDDSSKAEMYKHNTRKPEAKEGKDGKGEQMYQSVYRNESKQRHKDDDDHRDNDNDSSHEHNHHHHHHDNKPSLSLPLSPAHQGKRDELGSEGDHHSDDEKSDDKGDDSRKSKRSGGGSGSRSNSGSGTGGGGDDDSVHEPNKLVESVKEAAESSVTIEVVDNEGKEKKGRKLKNGGRSGGGSGGREGGRDKEEVTTELVGRSRL